MTATDELRHMLDERGVEHYDGTETTLWGYEPTSESTGVYRFAADETSGGRMQVRMFNVTPEQAIEATLGNDRLAFLEEKVKLQGDYIDKLTKEKSVLFAQGCEAATRHASQIDAMQRKLDAATLGRGTCHDSAGEQMAFFSCSACGATIERKHPRFCFACGRKVVED